MCVIKTLSVSRFVPSLDTISDHFAHFNLPKYNEDVVYIRFLYIYIYVNNQSSVFSRLL